MNEPRFLAGKAEGQTRQLGTVMVRLPRDLYDELVQIQAEIYAEQHWKVSLGSIIKGLLAGKALVKP